MLVSLLDPALNRGAAAGDRFVGIEGLILGSGNDYGWGSDADNYLYGLGGSDMLFGGWGADWHDGGAGRTVAYEILRELLREARQFNAREFRVLAAPT